MRTLGTTAICVAVLAVSGVAGAAQDDPASRPPVSSDGCGVSEVEPGTYRESMDLAGTARKLDALPSGISPGAKMVRPVKKGEIVTWDDIALDEDSTVVKLRREQDALFR